MSKMKILLLSLSSLALLYVAISVRSDLPIIPITQIVDSYQSLKQIFKLENNKLIILKDRIDTLKVNNIEANNIYNKTEIDSWNLIKNYRLEQDLDANNHNITNVNYLQANYIKFNKAEGNIDKVTVSQLTVGNMIVQSASGIGGGGGSSGGSGAMLIIMNDQNAVSPYSKFMCMEKILHDYFGKSFTFQNSVTSSPCNILLDDSNLPDYDNDGWKASWIVPPDTITLGSSGKPVESLCLELKGEGGTINDDHICADVYYSKFLNKVPGNAVNYDNDDLKEDWQVPPGKIVYTKDNHIVESLCEGLKREGSTLDDDKGTYHYTCNSVDYSSFITAAKNYPDKDNDGIKESWEVPPGKLKYSKDNYIVESLCEGLQSEGGTIPGKKSDGSYYTCDDVVYGTFLENLGYNINDLEDTDGDGLKEINCSFYNKFEVDNSVNPCSELSYKYIIYSKSNEMVEYGKMLLQTDFSVPQEVNKWKCYSWREWGSNPGGGDCANIQNRGPLWENGVMKIYNNNNNDRADVEICFDLGKGVYIDKVVFDYKICNEVVLYVGTERDHDVYVNDVGSGCKGWIRNKEVKIGKRGRSLCFWLADKNAYVKYMVYIDNVRLYIRP